MLNKTLHKHIDEMDAIEQKAQADIDKIISMIDISEIIRNPHEAMLSVAEEINKVMQEKYMAMASKQGKELVQKLESIEVIKIDPSKDPEKNKGIVDA